MGMIHRTRPSLVSSAMPTAWRPIQPGVLACRPLLWRTTIVATLPTIKVGSTGYPYADWNRFWNDSFWIKGPCEYGHWFVYDRSQQPAKCLPKKVTGLRLLTPICTADNRKRQSTNCSNLLFSDSHEEIKIGMIKTFHAIFASSFLDSHWFLSDDIFFFWNGFQNCQRFDNWYYWTQDGNCYKQWRQGKDDRTYLSISNLNFSHSL